jgi:hypothetical protein
MDETQAVWSPEKEDLAKIPDRDAFLVSTGTYAYMVCTVRNALFFLAQCSRRWDMVYLPIVLASYSLVAS